MFKRLVKMQRKGAVVIPRNLREQVGVADGDLMEIELLKSSQFLITPQPTINRSVIGHPKRNRKQVLADLAAVVQDLRREAKAKGLNKLTMREINATVAAARRGMKKDSKQPAK